MCALNVCRHEGHYEPSSLSTQAYPIAFPLSGPMQGGKVDRRGHQDREISQFLGERDVLPAEDQPSALETSLIHFSFLGGFT